MSLIRLRCSCGKRLKVVTKFAGKTGKCPRCGKSIPIPTIAKIHEKLAELHLDLGGEAPDTDARKGEVLFDNAVKQGTDEIDDGPSVYLNVQNVRPTLDRVETEDLEQELDQISETEIRREIGGLMPAPATDAVSPPSTEPAPPASPQVSAEPEAEPAAEPETEDAMEAVPHEDGDSPLELVAMDDPNAALETSSLEAEALENSRIIRALNLEPIEEMLLIERPEKLVTQGEQCFKDDELDKALLFFSKAISDDPEYAPAYFNRAKYFHLQRAWDLALEDLQKAEECGDHTEKLTRLKKEIIMDKARWLRQIKAFSQALLELDKHPDQEDKEVVKERLENYWARAGYLMEADAIGAALKDLDAAIEGGLSTPATLRVRGKAHVQLQQFDKAVEDFTLILNQTPDSHLYRMRAQAYAELGAFDKAIADLDLAIKDAQETPALYHQRGQCYAKRNQYDQALEDFERAVALDTLNHQYYLDRGQVYIAQKAFDKAIAEFTQVLELDPYNDQAYHFRGLCYRDMPHPQPAEAMKDFRKAEEIRRESEDAD